GRRVLPEVPGRLGPAGRRKGADVPRQEQHRPRRGRQWKGSDGGDSAERARLAEGCARQERTGAHDDRRGAGAEGHLHDGERAERSHRQARHAHRRQVLPLARRQTRDPRPRHARRCRQRRRLPADDPKLPVEVTSLYREPERREQLEFGALEYHDVFKIFRSGPAETVALRGLDLRIEPRELVGLLGPSGSGKSTALQLAAGLDEPSAGDVRVFGRSLTRAGDAELARYRARELAIVFQGGNLWPLLSARDNVELIVRL